MYMCGTVAASAERTGTFRVDIGLGNSVQEMEIGERVDGSVNAGDPTRGSTGHCSVRIGCGGDGADGTDGVGLQVRLETTRDSVTRRR